MTIIWNFNEPICSKVDVASALVREVVNRLEKNAWNEKDVFGVHMALEEALMNAVKHGNANDCTKKIDVEIRLGKTSFYAKITDEGQGFDLESVPDPCEECNLEKTSGRGVSLIRSFVDVVNYNDIGNMIEIEKNKSN